MARDAGVIEGNGAPSIGYHARRPGDYQITVTTHYGDDATELRLAAVVKVTEPSATEPPTAAAPPEAAVAAAPSEAPEQTTPPAVAPDAPPTTGAPDAEPSVAGAAEPQGATAPAATTEQPEPTGVPTTETAASSNRAIERPGQTPEEQAAPAESAAVTGQEAAQPPAPDPGAPTEVEQEPLANAPRDAQVAALAETGAAAVAGSRLDRIRDRRR